MQTTTKSNVTKISVMAMLCALSVVLVLLIRFPLFPGAPRRIGGGTAHSAPAPPSELPAQPILYTSSQNSFATRSAKNKPPVQSITFTAQFFCTRLP